ncbi:heavy metal translocating P-type ATPase [Symbiobacterium terraclitae]|uniref:heavy metal translocating P-type ATPase n=1 Tax=Symbiobacterium terraclitae TaxID=557451 RepID=UPI0035B55E72
MANQVNYTLKGLDCANCAAKIEDALHRNGMPDAVVSFATGQLLVAPDQLAQAEAVIRKIEPGITIVPAAGAAAQAAPAPHGEEHDAAGEPGWRRVAEMVPAAAVVLAGWLYHEALHAWPWVEWPLFLSAYLLVGRGVVLAALRNIGRGQLFDENFLMTIATLGAFAIHELPEAVAVMLFYAVGEYYQDKAVAGSRRSIRALVAVRPDRANLRKGGEVVPVAPEVVAVGDEIIVRPGERIPLDGEVIEGSTYIDTSALTGESMPRAASVGDTVLAGTVNTRGLIAVRVTRPFGDSSIARVLQLVEQAAARKAPTERAITSFARWYTPAVVGLAALIALVPPLVLSDATFAEWLRRALVLLVISCPCALVVSVPLSYFGGIGAASRVGILVKGGNYLDALARLDTVVWDKTGTLTEGRFQVVTVETGASRERDEVLRLAAHAEAHTSHPIAASILEAYGRPVDLGAVTDYEEIAGHGVRARVDGVFVLAGNERLLAREGVALPDRSPAAGGTHAGTVVHVAVDGAWAGRILIADQPKPASADAVRQLRALGVRRQVMLTGDAHHVAEAIAQRLALDGVRADLLPEDKVTAVEEIDRERRAAGRAGALAFVGDGINDAPVLTRADVGVAMGGLGSDAAIEAADVVIMDDNPARLAVGVSLARRTKRIVAQNIAFALIVKILFMVMGTAGMADLWEAVFADVGVSLLAVLNATRVLRTRLPKLEAA